MGVHPALPVDGATVILGNDIAGSRVWADVPPPVQVSDSPVCQFFHFPLSWWWSREWKLLEEEVQYVVVLLFLLTLAGLHNICRYQAWMKQLETTGTAVVWKLVPGPFWWKRGCFSPPCKRHLDGTVETPSPGDNVFCEVWLVFFHWGRGFLIPLHHGVGGRSLGLCSSTSLSVGVASAGPNSPCCCVDGISAGPSPSPASPLSSPLVGGFGGRFEFPSPTSPINSSVVPVLPTMPAELGLSLKFHNKLASTNSPIIMEGVRCGWNQEGYSSPTPVTRSSPLNVRAKGGLLPPYLADPLSAW
uniref:Uncharacterized protein n=1 Tax=Knipowitschia caucasica TaxID=637954 RepID=A0AAV2MFX4_KNICA